MISKQDDVLISTLPKGMPLILALAGSTDAGLLTTQLDQYFWEHCELQEVLRFNTDLLIDYRSRRPLITFNEDHFEDFEPLELVLYFGHDTFGNPFLVLSGFEPDFRWEELTEALLELCDRFEISVTAWAHAIPMPVPHTRSIGTTVSGTREDLIEHKSVWKPTTKLPASFSHLLEFRLQSLGENVVGFALLIPHYLSANEYPDALVTALDRIMSGTGLIFDTKELHEISNAFRKQVDAQIQENTESVQMLHGLESRYDDYMSQLSDSAPLLAEGADIPTADQLASELERFLAQQPDDENGTHGL